MPKYLLTGGVGYSWEWLTQVKPCESWKYDAIGKPLWSRAEGWTRLEDLQDGRTQIHFRETYHAFNPVMRIVLERRVHDFHLARQRQAHHLGGEFRSGENPRDKGPSCRLDSVAPDSPMTIAAMIGRYPH